MNKSIEHLISNIVVTLSQRKNYSIKLMLDFYRQDFYQLKYEKYKKMHDTVKITSSCLFCEKSFRILKMPPRKYRKSL